MNREDLICPGESIKELLETFNYTQDDLAEKLDMNLKTVNEILNGKAPITIETAIKLEYIFNINASFWNNLELNYRRKLKEIEEAEKAEKEYEYIKETYKEMIKRNLIEKTKYKIDAVNNFKKFMEITDISQLKLTESQLLYRKANVKYNYLNLLVWVQIGLKKAREVEINEFNKELLVSKINDIKKLTLLENQYQAREELKRICSECGVILNFEKAMPNAAVFGIAQWLTPTKPFIQISDRRKELSTFYFTLMHELGHILYGRKKMVFYDFAENHNVYNDDKKDIRILNDVEEIRADNFAKNNLISETQYKRFAKGNITETTIIEFAKENGVSPAIVAGRLRYDMDLYNNRVLNKFITKIEF